MSAMAYTDATTTLLKYEPNRILYGLSEEDLETIKNSSKNTFKDIAIGCLGLGVPCLINGINGISRYNNSKWPSDILLNISVAIATISLFIFCCIYAIITWRRNNNIYQKIKNRPPMVLSKIQSTTEQALSGISTTISG